MASLEIIRVTSPGPGPGPGGVGCKQQCANLRKVTTSGRLRMRFLPVAPFEKDDYCTIINYDCRVNSDLDQLNNKPIPPISPPFCDMKAPPPPHPRLLTPYRNSRLFSLTFIL